MAHNKQLFCLEHYTLDLNPNRYFEPDPNSLVLQAGPQEVVMRVTWATMLSGDSAGHVIFGSARGTNRSVTGSPYSYSGDAFSGTLHTAVMDGLETGMEYVYTVVSAAGVASRD